MPESHVLPRPVVVGIGEILWDMLPSGKRLGGAPANFAVQARSLGAEGLIAGAVGGDALGREILKSLAARGIPPDFIAVVPDAPTGTVAVKLDAEGVPEFTIASPVAWDVLRSTPALTALASKADAVCFGTLAQRSLVTRTTIRDFLDATRPECWRVFDLNLRQRFYSREIIADLLGRSRILKLNDEELGTIAGLFSLAGGETDILARLRDTFSLEIIALTKGSGGSRIFGRGSDSVHPGFSVDVVDTVGAGDAFAAALVMGILDNKSLGEINEAANRLAGRVCSQRGAWPEIPAETAIRAEMEGRRRKEP
jgi:fructokinase